MSSSINPIFPVIAAQGAAPDLVLKPGTVIDAEVLRLLSDDLVRIAISGLSIEVFSEIPLQVGQALQLAVSQTPDGIRLAVVGANVGAKAVASADAVTLAPDTIVDVATTPPVGAAPAINQPSRNELTPLERVAVAAAAESAATQQESLAPLFTNLDAVAASNALPPKLQQAVMQVLGPRSSRFCLGPPSIPPWMPRRGRSRRSRSCRRLLRRRLLKQQLRRMLRRHQRLPHPLPKSTCRKFFCHRRACRLQMTLWNWAAPSASCSLKRLTLPGHVPRQPVLSLPCCRRYCRKVRRKSVTRHRQRR